MMKRAIVFGQEGVNAVGLVQSLGREGVFVISVLMGERSSIIRHSRYSGMIYFVHDFDEALDLMLEKCVFEEPVVIFPAGDGAAVFLENHREKLQGSFVFEYTKGPHNIAYCMNKLNQVKFAKDYGFNVPYSVRLNKGDEVPAEMIYPCIVKPLVSCEGDKRDIMIAGDSKQLASILKDKLQFTNEVIIQQRINRDFDYNMIGCACENGDVLIPLSIRAIKFNHKVQDAKTVCIVEPLDEKIKIEVEKMKKMMRGMGYVGLFAVECMHNRDDDKIYFTEINLRNDGLNSFIVKGGVNLPYLHFLDLMGLPRQDYTPTFEHKKYIWEANHISALKRHSISIWEWLRDLKGLDGFLYYLPDDKRPFFYQFINPVLSLFRFRK